MSARILVVDDNERVRSTLVAFLEEEGYVATAVPDGDAAWARVAAEPPDLILLDLEMPVTDGVEVCRRLKSDPRTALIPVTILTAHVDREDHLRAIEAGADDFLGKPVDVPALRARLRTQLRIKAITDQLERTETVIFAMARWVEMKDHYTEGHLRRVAGYSEQIAQALGVTGTELVHVRFAGLLHDIGKIGIPDAILGKPGPLTPEEREIIERHPEYGAEIIAPLRFAPEVAPMVLSHHERWDGRGYPRRLRGRDVPVGARIIAVVDSWDAMTTDRPYRAALPEAEAVRRLREGAGSQWDPDLTQRFLGLQERGELAPMETPGGEPMAA